MRQALLILATLCLLAGGIGTYARHAVLDRDAFADRAAHTLDSDEVREEAAARIAARLVQEHPRLWGGEPLLEAALEESVVPTAAFQAGFGAGAGRLHDALFEDPGAEASLRVPGSGRALRAELRRRMPALALPELGDPPVLTAGQGARERALRDVAPVARALTVVAPAVLALGLLLVLVAATGGVWGAGMAVAASGALTAAAVTAARDVVLRQFDTGFGDAVVSAIWSAYVGELRIWALAAGAAGLVVAALAGGPRLRPLALLAAPTGRAARAARALALLVIAATAVALPELVVHLALFALAGALVYVATRELVVALRPARTVPRTARLPAGAASPAGSSTSRPR